MKRSFELLPKLTLCLAMLVLPAPVVAQNESPLPTPEEIVERMRGSLRSDRSLLSEYTYTEVEETILVNKKGEAKDTNIRTYEIFPSIFEELTYRRLISKDGKPVPEKKLREQDKKHDKRVEKYVKKAKENGTTFEEELKAAQERSRRKESRQVDEIFQLYDITVHGREEIGDHTTILVSFDPKPNYKAKSRELKMLKKIRGRAWINESDYQLVRIEAEVLKNLKFGLGILANLKKGANFAFQRTRINEEIWLPAEVIFNADGRVLFKGFRVRHRTLYSDYKKFSVGTSITFAENH